MTLRIAVCWFLLLDPGWVAVIGRRDGRQPTDTFWPERAVEHNAHNLKIAGYTASEHKRATVAADP